MTGKVRIDGEDHDLSSLTEEAKAQLAMIQFGDAQIAELTNMQALLTRAKKSYIDGLEREIIKARTGVDFSSLLSD
jgi:hypothetical protein